MPPAGRVVPIGQGGPKTEGLVFLLDLASCLAGFQPGVDPLEGCVQGHERDKNRPTGANSVQTAAAVKAKKETAPKLRSGSMTGID